MFERIERVKISKKVALGTLLIVGGVTAGYLTYRYLKSRE